MRHWLVTHTDGEQTLHCTQGGDPAAEGIDPGVACIEVPAPDHDCQIFNEDTGRWEDCPSKLAAEEQAARRRLSHAQLVERVLILEQRLDELAPVSAIEEGQS